MKEIITSANVREFAALLASENAIHDYVRTLEVPVKPCDIPKGDAYHLGCRFHRFLERIKDHGPLKADEMMMLPWLKVIRNHFRENGVYYIKPEVSLDATVTLPNGRCDLVLSGGPTSLGIAEIKVVSVLPEKATMAHLLQLAAYEELAAWNYDETQVWGAVVYVSFLERKVRLFTYRNCTGLRRAAKELLAA